MTIKLFSGESVVHSFGICDSHPLVEILMNLDKRDKGTLSVREVEILHQVATGKRAKEIAMQLSISRFTAQAHIRNIYYKLGVRTCAEALAKTGIT